MCVSTPDVLSLYCRLLSMLVNRMSRVPIIDGGGRNCCRVVRMRAFFDRPLGAASGGRFRNLCRKV